MDMNRRALLAAATSLSLLPAARAENFPERPIRMIVPFFAGGNTDMIARTTGDGLTRSLGQPVVIDNKPGAGGLLALNELVRARPDGYTIALGTPSTQIITALVTRDAKVDAIRETQPIGMLCGVPLVLVVWAGLPVKTVAELVEYARARPGTLSFASDGVGTSTHLAMEMFCQFTGVRMVHVPYKGSYAADMGSGLVHLAIAGARSQLALAETGKIRILAAASEQRLPFLPRTPTIAEAGNLPGFDASSWYALFLPAGVQPNLVATLAAATRAATAHPDYIARITGAGFLAHPGGPAEVAAIMARDKKKWGDVVDRLGLKI
jgi:tripartite-type tricarboxylate transporter receptor subunit TctC